MIVDGDNLFQCMSRMIAEGGDPCENEQQIWDRYGETVAILIIDSSGFSRTSQSHGILHFLSRLMQLRQICESVLQNHRCKRLHFEADNATAAFNDPSDAVRAALALQQAVYQSGLMLNERERFRISAGIGYGRLLYSETLEGYFGDQMNIASKLGEDIACGDEILLSEAVYKAAQKVMPTDIQTCDIEVSGIQLRYYRHRFQPGLSSVTPIRAGRT
ncbi:adenylate/guanylate cyclase domain-containing protein [Parahaliea maris]|uniref:Adenylate/guanylate cyclase domain-containing protein n=1 Tax=Parahaliea maris TaxID=2716870 RepID=A0A5C8ZXY7_9GAMM|nr:adenylate/guanylate cyclase domain-containing protein [Parahaliea maris]TXS92101.1 adenylate/guanylate cyclase domain-containing protein [Parahaliea maris]